MPSALMRTTPPNRMNGRVPHSRKFGIIQVVHSNPSATPGAGERIEAWVGLQNVEGSGRHGPSSQRPMAQEIACPPKSRSPAALRPPRSDNSAALDQPTHVLGFEADHATDSDERENAPLTPVGDCPSRHFEIVRHFLRGEEGVKARTGFEPECC